MRSANKMNLFRSSLVNGGFVQGGIICSRLPKTYELKVAKFVDKVYISESLNCGCLLGEKTSDTHKLFICGEFFWCRSERRDCTEIITTNAVVFRCWVASSVGTAHVAKLLRRKKTRVRNFEPVCVEKNN